MITPVTNPNAMNYWLHTDTSDHQLVSYSDIAESSDYLSCKSADLIRDAWLYKMDVPLDVIFPSASLRRNNKQFRCHVLHGHIPGNSFVKLTDSLYLICPELSFVLAAQDLSVAELVCLANNMCAIYRPDDTLAFKQASREAVTSVEKISDYIDKARYFKGIDKARKAIRYALNNSNSPRESIMGAIFRIPFSQGGAGLTDIVFNRDNELSLKAASFLGRPTCCCDISGVNVRTVFEYDSDLTHLTSEQHKKDKRRATALAMSGYKVISVTSNDFINHVNIDNLIITARDAMGLRTHMDRFRKYQYKRWKVMDELIFNNKNNNWLLKGEM